jgi:hypothetical protein
MVLGRDFNPQPEYVERMDILSVCLDSMCPLKLNPSNRRGTRPVCQVVWEGRRREASPYPDRCPIRAVLCECAARSPPETAMHDLFPRGTQAGCG